MPATVCLVPIIWARGYGNRQDIFRIYNCLLFDAFLKVAINIRKWLVFRMVLQARIGIFVCLPLLWSLPVVKCEPIVRFAASCTKKLVYIAVRARSRKGVDSPLDAGEEDLVMFIPVQNGPLKWAVWWNADLDSMRTFVCGLCKVVNPAIGSWQ
jgi:hypothetical protein